MKKIFALLSVFTLLCSNVFAVEITVKNSIINNSTKTEEYDFNKMNAFTVKNETKSAFTGGSAINVKCTNTINGEMLNIGDKVEFAVANDIKANDGTILLKEGTPVYGEILSVKKKSKIGQSGTVTIGDFYTNGVDGTIVTSSSNITEKAKSNVAKSIILSAAVIPLFLLMEGKDVIIPAGSVKTIHTDNTAYIKGENI